MFTQTMNDRFKLSYPSSMAFSDKQQSGLIDSVYFGNTLNEQIAFNIFKTKLTLFQYDLDLLYRGDFDMLVLVGNNQPCGHPQKEWYMNIEYSNILHEKEY